MDYHEGGDLLKYLTSHMKMTESIICIIMKQLLTAVAYMHNKKIVHRDLNPENILISNRPDLSIKVIDFDTAANFAGSPLRGNLGTFHYMAPEVVNKVYDEKCDL